VSVSLVRSIPRVLYGLYVWVEFLLLALLTVGALLVTPGLERRRALTRGVARLSLRLAGLRLRVSGEDTLPSGQSVVVANHASYLDGLVMKAVLPPRFSFVIKREMSSVPLAGLLLRRIGSEFVERFDRRKGASDARRVLRKASHGHSLVFFPEGTFSRQPGLLRFHTGAFATAARAGCPVVPAVIRGTREALPCSRLLPTPGTIDVEFLPPATPAAAQPDAAAADLRDRVRREMLARLGEPDLAAA
jgi:1-acyl-sn-glycerol-3-phosphate acyltransferase